MTIRHRAIAAAAFALMGLGTTAAAQRAATTTPFTLAEALAHARREIPEIAASRARVESAREAVGESGWWPNPVVEFRTENFASGVSRSVLPLDTFAEVTQVIELGGKRGARRNLAEAEAASALAAAALVESRVALDVTREYLDAVRLRDHWQSLALHVQDLDEAARVLERRVREGTTAEADLLRVRTEAARAVNDMTRAELAAVRALISLTARLAVDVTLDALVAPDPPPLPSLEDAMLSSRPDVSAAARAVESARQALRLEDARGVPDPAVNAGYKRTAGYNTGLVTVTMSLPLFNRNRPARVLAQGQVAAAELEHAAVERRARGDMAATRAAAESLALRARDARTMLVTPALGARDAARAAFSTGVLDVLRLVDVERVYIDAALAAIDLEIDAVAAAIEARVAAGREPLP